MNISRNDSLCSSSSSSRRSSCCSNFSDNNYKTMTTIKKGYRSISYSNNINFYNI